MEGEGKSRPQLLGRVLPAQQQPLFLSPPPICLVPSLRTLKLGSLLDPAQKQREGQMDNRVGFLLDGPRILLLRTRKNPLNLF